jgi:hypothetical protein
VRGQPATQDTAGKQAQRLRRVVHAQRQALGRGRRHTGHQRGQRGFKDVEAHEKGQQQAHQRGRHLPPPAQAGQGERQQGHAAQEDGAHAAGAFAPQQRRQHQHEGGQHHRQVDPAMALHGQGQMLDQGHGHGHEHRHLHQVQHEDAAVQAQQLGMGHDLGPAQR